MKPHASRKGICLYNKQENWHIYCRVWRPLPICSQTDRGPMVCREESLATRRILWPPELRDGHYETPWSRFAQTSPKHVAAMQFEERRRAATAKRSRRRVRDALELEHCSSLMFRIKWRLVRFVHVREFVDFVDSISSHHSPPARRCNRSMRNAPPRQRSGPSFDGPPHQNTARNGGSASGSSGSLLAMTPMFDS